MPTPIATTSHMPGDAVLVAEADAADGGRAAEHDGGHRAGVEHRAEPAAGDEEVGLGLARRLPQKPKAIMPTR